MQKIASGRFEKMHVEQQQPVQYKLLLESGELTMNDFLGKPLKLVYEGSIRCRHCQRVTKKSFDQGFCYPCFQRLAQCDRCIKSPELCHFDQGTCREPDWGLKYCMQPHIVYLANSSGVKVGITRKTQVPTRWIDQGAIAAIPVMEVSSRRLSGLVEDALREWLPDKTNWRKMLKHEVESVDLIAKREEIKELAEEKILDLASEFPDENMEWLEGSSWEFDYPALNWPVKALTYNFDKEPVIEDRLIAIKGQYLIFEKAALNVRKFTSYDVSVYADSDQNQ